MGADPAAVEQFGPYLVYEHLGVGGMATVHRALERGIQGFERTVALKRLLPHLAADATFISAFVREARLASYLKHVNIVQQFELGRVGAAYFISMEYIDGRDIRRILRHARKVSGPPPIHVTIGILLQLCAALDYAHHKADDDGRPLGLVHRDVSPSNVLITTAGQIKVIDFGIAKAQSAQLRTQTGRVKGKLAYMAPEALAGKELDARSDLFAAGVIAHELLTARPLFATKNEYQTLMKVQRGEVMPPSTFNQGCPPELDAIVLRALARDPDERFSEAAELRDDLLALRKQYNLATGERDIVTWIDWAFSLEAPSGGFHHDLDASSDLIDLGSPRGRTAHPRRNEDDEAIELAWGDGVGASNGQPVLLDDVPDVSAKHLSAASALGAEVRLDLDDLADDMPTPLPGHGIRAAAQRAASEPGRPSSGAGSRPGIRVPPQTATPAPARMSEAVPVATPAARDRSQAIPVATPMARDRSQAIPVATPTARDRSQAIPVATPAARDRSQAIPVATPTARVGHALPVATPAARDRSQPVPVAVPAAADRSQSVNARRTAASEASPAPTAAGMRSVMIPPRVRTATSPPRLGQASAPGALAPRGVAASVPPPTTDTTPTPPRGVPAGLAETERSPDHRAPARGSGLREARDPRNEIRDGARRKDGLLAETERSPDHPARAAGSGLREAMDPRNEIRDGAGMKDGVRSPSRGMRAVLTPSRGMPAVLTPARGVAAELAASHGGPAGLASHSVPAGLTPSRGVPAALAASHSVPAGLTPSRGVPSGLAPAWPPRTLPSGSSPPSDRAASATPSTLFPRREASVVEPNPLHTTGDARLRPESMPTERTPLFHLEDLGAASDTVASMPALPSREAIVRFRRPSNPPSVASSATFEGAAASHSIALPAPPPTTPPAVAATPAAAAAAASSGVSRTVTLLAASAPAAPGAPAGPARYSRNVARLITPATALFAEPEPDELSMDSGARRSLTRSSAARSLAVSAPTNVSGAPGWHQPSRPSPPAPSAALDLAAPRAWRQHLLIALVVLGATATAAVAVWRYLDRSDDASTSASPPASAPRSAAMATLKLVVHPSDARIAIEGVAIHAGSPWSVGLPPGVHQVKIDRDGYKGWLTSIDFAAGETRRVELTLEPLGPAVVSPVIAPSAAPAGTRTDEPRDANRPTPASDVPPPPMPSPAAPPMPSRAAPPVAPQTAPTTPQTAPTTPRAAPTPPRAPPTPAPQAAPGSPQTAAPSPQAAPPPQASPAPPQPAPTASSPAQAPLAQPSASPPR